MLLVLAAVGSIIGIGGVAMRDTPEAGSLAAAMTAAPSAADGAPVAPRPSLPSRAEVAFDEEHGVLVVTDAVSGEELTVSERDVSSVNDGGGPTVTLELWGLERLEVPRAVYERLRDATDQGDQDDPGTPRAGGP